MTELIWEGKYRDGRKVAPVRIPLPFQTIETVNESAVDRQRTLDMFAEGRQTEWRNRLIWGDKKYILPSLLPEFAGKVNLIYIDPPFDTGADFSFMAKLPDNPETERDETTQFVKEPSILEQKAYRDTWGRGLDSYLQWFYETVVLLYETLADNGSIYVHLDWHVVHYAKAIMDEVFGYEGYRNQIVWQRTNAHNINPKYYLRIHDVILFYCKTGRIAWNPQFTEYSEQQKKRYKPDENGRLFTGQDLTMSSASKSRNFEWRGSRPPGNRGWALSLEGLERLWSEQKILVKEDGCPRLDGLKVYLDETEGKRATDLWTDIQRVGNTSDERVDYPTQKPVALLQRILQASSNEKDLILDCFCGSGTTAVAAEGLNRRWIACDLGRFAVHTARKRLLQLTDLEPFVVQNLGKYERQVWQTTEFPSQHNKQTQEKAYRNFILNLYHAEPLKGFVWLHGAKSGRLVHVGAVDAPIALGDVKAIVLEFWKAVGKSPDVRTNGVDVLGWEFAFDINETAIQQAAASNVDIKFKKIPREVLDKKAVEQGDVHFFELAGLNVKSKVTGKKVELTLKDFIIPPDDVPEDVRQAITHWSQWIDYWAVDWNYREDTFHNEWQSYRTKKEPGIALETSHTYESKGTYTIVVKVIDILGNDTTKALTVKIA